jgi:hypothetical protein
MAYLLNALPMSCIPSGGCTISLTPIQGSEIPADVESAVGHADTAAIIGGLLGRPFPMNRVSVPALEAGGVLFVAAYQGPRLPEGATQLPLGATLVFYRVAVEDQQEALKSFHDGGRA